jgi:parallel beta-helix repeat protein
MKRILWLVIVFLFLIPQASALGFSSSQSTLSASPNGGKELNLLQAIQSFISAHKSPPNASDAYTIHPGFPNDISGWIKKSSITIADINSDGRSDLTDSMNPTSPGELLLNATIESIGIVAPYIGDDNQNNSASLRYRAAGSLSWLAGHELYVDRSSRQWRGSMVSLSPDTTYEIEVQFTDPDGASPSSQSGSISTRPDYPEVGNGGTVRYVPDSGNLQNVINAASPGDTIRIRAGTYYTSATLSENNSGTPGHYLTIEADPGAHVVLDGSEPSINNPNVDNWIQYQSTNIYYTDISWGDNTCNPSLTMPNYVGEQRNGDGVRFLLYNHGSNEWDQFLSAPPGKAFYSCDSLHTLGRLYVTTYEGDDPDNHEIHVSRYGLGLLLMGSDYVRIRNLEFRYYSGTSLYLRMALNGSGADNNIIEGNTFHGSKYGVYVGQYDTFASANNLIQDNHFYERGYKDSGWNWDTQYHFAWSGGVAVISAQAGNVIRRNHFNGGSDAIDVQFQSHDTDVYDNIIEDYMDDGIEVDQEPSYNIRVWGNTIRYCFSGVSTQDWFGGSYWNVGPIYIFRNLIVGGRDPQGRADTDGKVYSSEFAFKVGANVNGNGAGRVYYYHNTISIPDSIVNGNGIQNAGGIYFSGIVSRNNIWAVTRRVFQLTMPGTIVGHDMDCDNLQNPGPPGDDQFVKWSNTGGPSGNGVYRDIASFKSYTGQELHGISNSNTRFNSDFTLRAGSPEIDRGCLITGFNDRGSWAYIGVKPDMGAFEYSGISLSVSVYLPLVKR